ncbi:MAG TPA: type II toxin-antitoxin system VapC family toxin [Opitutaceae bacterium]|nr:type II toxin-antitoxin system VapC family toxin [Opitutaceae bacterium]
MVYADTSFLFSLVLHDANTAAAVAYLSKHPTPLALTSWQRCELHNAIRLSVFRGNCSETNANSALARIENDLAAGNLVETTLGWSDVMAIAETLSARRTTTLGVRSLDLLHIAAAVSLQAKTFLTCDGRQLALTRAAGIRVDKI